LMGFGFKPRDIRRAMKRLGMEVEEVKAERVEILLDDGGRLVIDEPQAVMVIRARGQAPMIYVVGEARRVEPGEAGGGEAAPEISEEDVALVAEQAGVSPEEARRALEEAGGDIAEAILRLTEGRGG
jgi:nascent polypeptide-associated complex subunit alpha